MRILLTLPFPPTVNTYWRHNRGRTHISTAGKAYRSTVVRTLIGTRGFPAAERLQIAVCCHPPDRRRRDLDNVLKALLDALAHAGAYHDDAQIDHLTISRLEPDPPRGSVLVTIIPIHAEENRESP